MKLGQGWFLIQEAFRTMNRHKGVAAVSITIMSLSLLILAVFLLVTDNMFVFMEKTKDEMGVYVYLEDYLTNEEINGLYAQIMTMAEVSQLVFISKEEALTEEALEIATDIGNRRIVQAARNLPAFVAMTLGEKTVEPPGDWEPLPVKDIPRTYGMCRTSIDRSIESGP